MMILLRRKAWDGKQTYILYIYIIYISQVRHHSTFISLVSISNIKCISMEHFRCNICRVV